MHRKVRLFYAAGAGDILGSYAHWRAGNDDPSQVAITYSSQFWDVCRQLGAESLAVSSHAREGGLAENSFRVEHRPKPLRGSGGILFHLAEIWYGCSLIVSILRFRADFAIVADGTTEWFLLGILRIFGVCVIPAVHALLWPKFQELRRIQRVLNALNGALLFRGQTHTILSVSGEVTAQLNSIGRGNRIVPFLPTFRPGSFAGIAPPSCADPFRVLFVGRIVDYKGVFTILRIARELRDAGETGIVFDIVGDGPDLSDLRAASERAGLGTSFACHGQIDRPVLLGLYERSHVVLVPTSTDFVEGLNKVVIEGVLAGRPVITSRVCPAVELLRDAVVEVAPDDEAGYRNAILALRSDAALYARKREACFRYQDRFYDSANGWGAALGQALAKAHNS
jgi:glycosyltransferase involved in cell wall biosynthesis